MKLKLKQAAVSNGEKSVSNQILPSTKKGSVEIYHQQSIRQSHNYQSAECVYGIKLTVPDDPASISSGFKRATSLVETNLVPKLEQHMRLLQKLSPD